ncbi:MAG: M81 family peptidase [Chloroflexi bacterium]|nr:MAG: M81 family peptidase [Chloroflexota bacterium]
MIQKRIAIGGILHETHTFMPQRTRLADFQRQSFYEGDAVLSAMTGTHSGIGGMIAAANDWVMLPILYAAAMPSGIIVRAAYEALRERFIARLRAVLPVDGVLLALHGAMVSEGIHDAESDLVAQIRGLVGGETPIVIELDMHGNISNRLCDLADVLVAYDTNPHIDMYERGGEAGQIMRRLLNDAIAPTHAYRQAGLLLAPQYTGTGDAPLLAVHQRRAMIEQDEDVICVAVMAGFAYADTPDTGVSIIVTTDDHPQKAEEYAEELAELSRQQAHNLELALRSPDDAVMQAKGADGGPVILVDSADNIGGGTPGDGTDLLAAMLRHDVQEGTIVLADAEAVTKCHHAGEGAVITSSVGGKTDRWHGEPITVTGTVQRLSDGVFTCELRDNPFASFYGDTIQMGKTAWLRVAGVNIILTEHKTPPFDLAQLRHIGVIPEQQKMIVVKSAVAYRAAYLPIAAAVIEVDCAGLCSANLSRFDYKYLKRPIVPLDSLSPS